MSLWRKDILLYQIRDACLYWLVIPALVLGSGWLLDQLLNWRLLPGAVLLPVAGLFLMALGGVFITAATHDFSRIGQGTPNPRRPPLILVRQGVYALCRHPMFFGYDLAGLGAVLLSRFPASLLISLPIFYIWQILFLRKEERYLTRRFKGEFAEYRQQVPFLLPLKTPFKK